jgi:GNAT superfamily N-acetyltransferase
MQADRPIGLAVGAREPNTDQGEVLSLFVAAEHRGRRIGTALLSRLQDELVQRGCEGAKLSYAADKPSVPALERVLARCGWAPPWPQMYICRSDRRVLDAPFARHRVPAPFSISPWLEISAADRAAIQRRQMASPWYPVALDPFAESTNVAPNSFALRRGDDVVGWIITHAVAIDTTRYSSVFVDVRLRNIGLGAALFGEALRRQDWDSVPKALGAIQQSNTTMIDIMWRQLAPYLVGMTETRGSYRPLSSIPCRMPAR